MEDFNTKTMVAGILGIVSIICIFTSGLEGSVGGVKDSVAAGFGLIMAIIGVAFGIHARRESRTNGANIALGMNWFVVAFCAIGFVWYLV